MSRSGGGRRAWGIVLAAGVLLGPPSSAGSSPATPRAETVRSGLDVPELPPVVEEIAARRRGRASNLMFAQLATDPYKGYHWSIVAYKANPSAKTRLMISFARSAARDTQVQSSRFSWTLPRSALSMDANLKPAALVTRKGMGTNGSIAMRLSNAGRYARVPAGEDCSGEISYRIARFGGRFDFHARDEYFKRIVFRRAQVVLYREHDFRCSGEVAPPPPCPQHLSITGADETSGVRFGAFKTSQGRVDQKVVVARASGTADAVHTISVTIAVPEAFEASEDLTSASVDGDAAGPWLTGDLDYVAPPASEGTDERCGLYRSSSGIATGDYTAHFDSIGEVTPATTGVPATLRQEL